jgi:hypothetical protein
MPVEINSRYPRETNMPKPKEMNAPIHGNEYEVSTGKSVFVRAFSLTKKMSIKHAINSMSDHNQP